MPRAEVFDRGDQRAWLDLSEVELFAPIDRTRRRASAAQRRSSETPARRTITITGRPGELGAGIDRWSSTPPRPVAAELETRSDAEGWATATATVGAPDSARGTGTRRRRTRLPHERPGFQPDRVALWALFLCLVLVLIAAGTAHAATLVLAH